MSADHRYLAHEEEVILRVNRHVTVLAKPFFQMVAVILLTLVVGSVMSPQSGTDLLDRILGIAAAAFVLRLGWKLWGWRVDRIIVTDRRIFEVSGILTRNVASMPLANMTDVTYRRSVLGRLLGYGELVVETAGQLQSLNRISHLPKPDDFYRAITFLVSVGLTRRPDPQTVREVNEDEDDTGPLPRVIV
jgi:membrane protein YdbS with pleckstrin-like domain